jgi:hypothetical protein
LIGSLLGFVVLGTIVDMFLAFYYELHENDSNYVINIQMDESQNFSDGQNLINNSSTRIGNSLQLIKN